MNELFWASSPPVICTHWWNFLLGIALWLLANAHLTRAPHYPVLYWRLQRCPYRRQPFRLEFGGAGGAGVNYEWLGIRLHLHG